MSLEFGRQVIAAEIIALQAVEKRLDEKFITALDLLQKCSGRIVTCGMGKAGIIAQKIAATLSSTGSPAVFLHPAEALHGDLGMVNGEDIALIFSNSGESEEITRLLPSLRRTGAGVIGITGDDRSTLAVQAEVVLCLGNIAEACPLGLAPTATTTAMLALGDALALALMRRKNFKIQDYAKRHPGGALGRKSLPIEDVMRVDHAVARVSPEATIAEVILAITGAQSGAAVVVDAADSVLGIFCDGDLRRGLEGDAGFLARAVADSMTAGCTTVRVGTVAGEVLTLMRSKRIAEIPVVDASGKLCGMADLKGMLASL